MGSAIGGVGYAGLVDGGRLGLVESRCDWLELGPGPKLRCVDPEAREFLRGIFQTFGPVLYEAWGREIKGLSTFSSLLWKIQCEKWLYVSYTGWNCSFQACFHWLWHVIPFWQTAIKYQLYVRSYARYQRNKRLISQHAQFSWAAILVQEKVI